MTKLFPCALFLAAAAFAQTERGNITGVVTDPAGATVPAADITVIHRDTNAAQRTVSTNRGEYNVPNLFPGNYRIEITAAGFKRYVQQNLMVTAGGTLRIDAALQLGQVSEQIEVSAAASTVQTDNAKVSTLVENKMV
ncbi:MAG: carboxypeptidase regulatory-like domain-containing protein, partial [Bryobacterales bacterium]|nr:carboxypeptidase regulatory-like domain-containing protein [Bryobacterales bacterium]